MRFVEITIPTGKRDAILTVLDEEGIDYVVTDEVSGREYTAVVSFPLPANAVEPILEELREAGLSDDAFTIVLDAETVISRRFEQLRNRFAEEQPSAERVAREEIQARAETLVPAFKTYAIMTIASVTVATAGILLDSAAVVVGSMVIAPLIGPAMATSVGTVLQQRDLFVRGVRFQVIGMILAVVTAAVFAVFVKQLSLVPPNLEIFGLMQVRERLAPDFLSLAVALGAGVAGAYSLSAGVATSLVGVMIAVALIPPTAVIGIGIAWGFPSVVLGSTVLVLVNFISINLAALAVLWYQGYRPNNWFLEETARTDTIKRLGILLLAIIVLSAFLGAVTYSAFQSAKTEESVREDIEAVLAQDQYAELSLVDMTIESETGLLTRKPNHVIVTVGRPIDAHHPDLVRAISDRLTTNQDLTVEVRFIDVDRTTTE